MMQKVNVGVGKLPMKMQSSHSRIFIKGGKIVNDDQMFFGDVYIEEGVIKQVGKGIVVPGGCRTIDATGKLVIPGGIDTHTHMQMPFMGTVSSDDFYTGTRAALAGGTTMIIDFVLGSKGTSILDSYNQYRNNADPKVCCDYGLHVIVPHFDKKVIEEMEILVREKGVNSFKAFMAYRFLWLEDDELYDLFRTCRKLGAIAMVHAENGKIIERRAEELYNAGVTGPEGHFQSRPAILEQEATERAITIAEMANCPLYVVHVMDSRAAEAVSNARRKGQIVFGESIAAALVLDGTHYFHQCWRHAAAYVLSPPLRSHPENSQNLMRFLASGDLECTGTDHCVFRADQKALGKDDFRKIPNGVNGVEERMSIVWEKGVVSGLLDPCKFVAITSSNAAKVFNIYPRKGRIAVGSDADIVVWDTESSCRISKDTHHQNGDFNVFEGMTFKGVPSAVITRGMVVLDSQDDDSGLKAVQGHGKFVETPPHCPYVYGRVEVREKMRAVKPIERDAYTGPVIDLTTSVSKNDSNNPQNDDEHAGDFHSRPPTRSGGRNMQDSTFSFGGGQIDDNQPIRTCIRTRHPPLGSSTGLW